MQNSFHTHTAWLRDSSAVHVKARAMHRAHEDTALRARRLGQRQRSEVVRSIACANELLSSVRRSTRGEECCTTEQLLTAG